MVMAGLAAKGIRKGVRKARKRIQKGKSVSAAATTTVRVKRRRRSRAMSIRRGKLYLGFTQKEVKGAMRRAYGGRRSKR